MADLLHRLLDVAESLDASDSERFLDDVWLLDQQEDENLFSRATGGSHESRLCAQRLVIKTGRLKEFSAALLEVAQDRSGMNTEELMLSVSTLSVAKFNRVMRLAFPHLDWLLRRYLT